MAKIRKALAAGLGAATAAIVTAAQDGQISAAEWLTVAVAALVTGWATWQIRNRRQTPPTPTPEA